MISGIILKYRKTAWVIPLLTLLISCQNKPETQPVFYHPVNAIKDHTIPVVSQVAFGNTLEQEVSFYFKNRKMTHQFRFRTAYFDYAPERGDSISVLDYSEINIRNLKDTLVLNKNNAYRLKHPLYIDSTGVLIFKAGSQLYIDDAVDILSKGSIRVEGEKKNPVLITAFDKYWGGIRSTGGDISMNHLMITRAGGNDTIKVRHSYSQPAIYMIGNGRFNASGLFVFNCLGKAMYIIDSRVKISRAFFAECDTGPEINWSKVEIDSLISINIPDSKEGEDDDNDAIYIFGRHTHYPKDPPRINHMMLGFAKDDGFDHGKNDMIVQSLLVYQIKDKAISLEGGHMRLNKVWLSDARVLIGVKQDTHAIIDSIYLSNDGQRTDMLEHMQQNPTLEISNEFTIEDKVKSAESFWFPLF